MNFSEKLYNLRKKSGLSQEQLAEALNVSRQAISKWESGRAVPEIDKLLVISKYFGVSLDYLMKDDVTNPLLLDEKDIQQSIQQNALLPGLVISIVGVMCLIIWGLVSIFIPETSSKISESSMIQLDGNGIFLLLSLVAIIVGAWLLLKNLHKK